MEPRRTLATLIVVAFAVLAAWLVPASVSAREAAPPTTTLLVKFKPTAGASARAAALARAGAARERSIPQLGVDVVRVPASASATALGKLRKEAGVQYAEPDWVRQPQDFLPSDPSFPATLSIAGGAWGWKKTRTTEAWDITRGDPSVVVAILDTGLKTAGLADFDGQVVAGWNVMRSSADTSTYAGQHGTHVAGVAGLAADNGIGNAGYCPGCRIMPVQIGTDSGASDSNMASGIVWAVDHGARVLNLSWAGTNASSTIASAVSYARAKGAVVVAAAGNGNCDCVNYPAAIPGVLGVAGSTSKDDKTGTSNHGNWVMVAAPESNLTAWPTINGSPGYSPSGGTSIAAPAVAGIAALLFSARPDASGLLIEQALEASAVPVSFAVRYGRVDAVAALAALGVGIPSVPSAPVNLRPPAVYLQTNGDYNYMPLARDPQPGDVLIRGQGSWHGAAPLTLAAVKWERCNSLGCITAGTSAKYTVQSSDAGYAFRLSVTVTNGLGAVSATAPLTAPVGGGTVVTPPTNTSLPTVSGTPRDGQTLTASPGSWSGSPTAYAYQWLRCSSTGGSCVALADATTSSYVVQSTDVDSTLVVRVTATNTGGSTSALSAATAVVTAAPAPPPPPSGGTSTWAFSSSLNPKNPTRSFTVPLGNGTVHVELAFSKCKSMTLSLQAPNSAVASTAGPSVVSLDASVSAGSYAFVVSGDRCAFTLTVRQ